MQISESQKLERLDLLESKVSKAVETVVGLSARCEDLIQEKEGLEKQIADLTDRNIDLAQEIVKLKSISELEPAKLIEEKSRVDEVARLLDGSLSKVSVDHAKALLDELGVS